MVTLFKGNTFIEKPSRKDINLRQVAAIEYLKLNDRITNKDYQILNKVSRNTASNDLKSMIVNKIIIASDKKGIGSFYILI